VSIAWYRFIAKFDLVTIFSHTSYEAVDVSHEIVFFAILGILCGCMASLNNLLITKLAFLRGKLKAPFISHRWKW